LIISDNNSENMTNHLTFNVAIAKVSAALLEFTSGYSEIQLFTKHI